MKQRTSGRTWPLSVWSWRAVRFSWILARLLSDKVNLPLPKIHIHEQNSGKGPPMTDNSFTTAFRFFYSLVTHIVTNLPFSGEQCTGRTDRATFLFFKNVITSLQVNQLRSLVLDKSHINQRKPTFWQKRKLCWNECVLCYPIAFKTVIWRAYVLFFTFLSDTS